MDEPKTRKSALSFDTVPVRERRDGWTPERQHAFIAALAESGCVTEACARVGMTTQSAYQLRRHFDAQGFRLAWDAALDYAIRRLSDAAFSRAIHGVPVPHYYKGELVGEHRRYDEALTRFLLRYRDPLRYAKSLDKNEYDGHDELFAIRLGKLMHHVESDRAELLFPKMPKPNRRRRARMKAHLARIEAAERAGEGDAPLDVPSTSSTSDAAAADSGDGPRDPSRSACSSA